MPKPVEIEPRAARDFLVAHLGREVSSVTFVGEGAWSRCFGYDDGEEERVIRFGRHRSDFDKDARAASFGSSALPVPKVFEVGEGLGGYFAISTRAHGEPLENLDVDGWRIILPEFFEALDALGALRPEFDGFGDWADGAPHATWRDYLLGVGVDSPERRTHGWRKKLAASAVGEAPFWRAHEKLGALAAEVSVEPRIVHADLINRNVLVEKGRLAAVFDWGGSIQGDSLYDLAWLEFWEPWHPAIEAMGVREAARSHLASAGRDVADFDARMRCCLVHIGLDHMAYCAFADRPEDLALITERTLQYAGV